MKGRIRKLRMWWLASLLVMLGLTIVVVGDPEPDFLEATAFFVGLGVCLLSAVACLRSQLQLIEGLHNHGINADCWYPRIALGIVFLLPGVLLEVGWFLLSLRRQFQHQ